MAIIKKSIVLHPAIERCVREAQAALIRSEPAVDASYSAAVNFLLLAAVLEVAKDGGFSPEVVEDLRGFLRDRKVLEELNLHDRLSLIREAFGRLEPHPE
jgi:hypothetical protein